MSIEPGFLIRANLSPLIEKHRYEPFKEMPLIATWFSITCLASSAIENSQDSSWQELAGEVGLIACGAFFIYNWNTTRLESQAKIDNILNKYNNSIETIAVDDIRKILEEAPGSLLSEIVKVLSLQQLSKIKESTDQEKLKEILHNRIQDYKNRALPRTKIQRSQEVDGKFIEVYDELLTS